MAETTLPAASPIDPDALSAWMDAQALPAGAIGDLQPLAGGTQNVMLRFRRDGREFVLRRGPRHLRPTSNRALRREIRVLRALEATEVPCPRIVAACEDESVLGGSVFYLMEPIDGFNATVSLPSLHAGSPAIRHEMGLRAIDALTTLAAVDHEAAGLGDLGRPQGFLARQVPRWLPELESYSRFDAYPGPDLPGVAEVAAWLQRKLPGSWRAGIVHGDYHLANLMFSQGGPQVKAVVDWEMCTIGDPLLDLGWLLATWPDAEHTSRASAAGALGDVGGLPTPGELVARYAERSARNVETIPWYIVLACFKLAIVLEGTYARACAGLADQASGDSLHGTAVALFERALDLIASRRP
jgi:aminoglycoside phosphotransferase (APT) family kinase protein